MQTLGLEKKARGAQLSVLSRYGVMADFSALEEAELDQALKGSVPVKMAQNMTFASWCNQLLGRNIRVPVARFDGHVPGQTRLSNLSVGRDLAKNLKARDRELQSAISAAETQVDQLKAELKALRQGSAHAEPVSRISERLCNWYYTISVPLQKILEDIKEIEGPIFGHQGLSNRDYRKQLFEVVLHALNNLECIGFSINVEMHDNSNKEPVSPSVLMHRSQVPDADGFDVKCFDFVIDDIQIDVFEEVSECFGSWQPQSAINADRRFNCHVKVIASQQLGLSEGELPHLSYFMHKLFEAIVRSGDSKPRGTLVEKVILCQLLSCTAPCMPATSQQLRPVFSDDFNSDSNIPAGVIVDHLFQILHGSIWS